jgi:alanine racemase
MSDSSGPKDATSKDLESYSGGDVPRVHRPARALPTDVVRPTRAEVHLAHLRHNLGLLRKAAGTTPIWAVLKADGYGHGAKAVARTLERAGTDGICVALVEEGVELREAGIRTPILVMGGYYGDAFRELSHHNLTPVLSDPGQVEAFEQAAAHAEQDRVACHVKVDTGMARLGTRQPEWPRLIETLCSSSNLRLEGLMSHLADADVPEADALSRPLSLFAEAEALFNQGGLAPRLRHMANSAAFLRDRRTHFDMVRPGIALFGENPIAHLKKELLAEPALDGRLKSTMSVHSRIVSLRTISVGDAVGYGGTFVARRPTDVATVPMGYADGLARLVSNRASVLIRGQRAPIVGNVSMDMTMIDVTDVPGVAMRDDVVFLGHQKGPLGDDTISATEMASWCDSIPWEVLTNISRRVPRFYREA